MTAKSQLAKSASVHKHRLSVRPAPQVSITDPRPRDRSTYSSSHQSSIATGGWSAHRQTPACFNWSTLTNASICADDQHSEIRAVAGEAEDGGLKVLVVTGQINECDHFRGTFTNLLCCPRLAVIHNLGQKKKKKHNIWSSSKSHDNIFLLLFESIIPVGYQLTLHANTQH